jgi:hypothetical protein
MTRGPYDMSVPTVRLKTFPFRHRSLTRLEVLLWHNGGFLALLVAVWG